MIHENIHLNEQYPFLSENGRDPVLTLYIPDYYPNVCGSDKRPSILICPGGGYGFVSPREAEPIALNFLHKGFNVFVVTYSVAPHTFPVQLREVAAAMEMIHKNAESWYCDPDKVAILGFSAGGHLACHYSNCFDCEEVRAVFPESKAVRAAVLCYPVISADPDIRHAGSFQNLTGQNTLTAETEAQFSLEKKVTAHTPPTFLWHTAADALVPVANSLVYARALAEHKVPLALRIYPKGDHGLATADEQTCKPESLTVSDVHEWMDAAAQWLKDTMI